MAYSYFDESLPHVVIVGGGFAGLQMVKSLRKKPFRVTLIDQRNHFTFQPLLYQVASGGIGPDGIAYPLRKIVAAFSNTVFRMAGVTHVDTAAKKIETTIGDFSFDYLVVATGAQTNFFGNTSLEKNCLQLKSIPDALDMRTEILQEFEKAVNKARSGNIDAQLDFVVVGGGPTGVETAGALAEMKKHVLPADYRELDASRMRVHLVEASPRLLNTFSEKSSAAALKALQQLGVQVQLATSVKEYDGKTLVLSTGESWETDTVIWAAGVKGKGIDGIPVECITRGNRYKVNAFNQVHGFEHIFAIGDIALMEGDANYPNGHPMVAQPGMQQAKLLAENLQRLQNREALKPFLYKDLGSMATVGRHKAVSEVFGTRTTGLLAWLGWMFLHLMLLVGFRNRVVVFVNWMWNYFSYERAIRLIIRPFERR